MSEFLMMIGLSSVSGALWMDTQWPSVLSRRVLVAESLLIGLGIFLYFSGFSLFHLI